MQSLTFTPGRAFLSSDSHTVPWTAVFEDEGAAGYFYACDRSREKHDESILDAMLVYNVAALTTGEAGETRERMASIEWSRDGMKAVLYLDGVAQALFDFAARCGYCRSNFPNFLAEQGESWNRSSHAWSDAAFEQFEAALYA
jgi:hypothetical protein